MDHHYLVREIILKYHRGETLTDEEQKILDGVMANLPSDKVWERVRSHVEGKREGQVIRPWYIRWPMVTAGAAAAAAVIMLVSVGLYRYQGHSGSPSGTLAIQRVWRTVAPGHYHRELAGPEGITVVDSASGGQADPYPVTLPDGSKVTLSYGSSIRYAQTFAERKVSMSGQVFFDVAKDERPFMVESGNTTVQVLGTRFNWMHYPGVPDEITLLDGKVRLSRGNFGQELTRAERAVIHEGNPIRVKVERMEGPEKTVAWMHTHSIVFDSDDLYQVIQRMAQYYQVGFHVVKELQNGRPVSGILDLERPLAENLAPIAYMLKEYAHVEETNGMIEVTN
jgi:FecR protein